MDPHCLLKDELEYELASRGVVLVSSTVPALKKLLHELLFNEQTEELSREIKIPRQITESIKSELNLCSSKLNILSNYISEIIGKPDKNLFRRLVSRLYHVRNRLNLLNNLNLAEDEAILKNALNQQCNSLLQQLEGRDDGSDSEDLTVEDRQILQETLGDLGIQIIKKLDTKATTSKDEKSPTEDIGLKIKHGKGNSRGHHNEERDMNARLFRSSTVDEDFPSRRKLVPVSQWGLKFSGADNMSINAFIERVVELKDARNATDHDLWRYAIDLFDGEALIWYRANREYANNWADLVILLKRTFQKPFYQEELLLEINSRTQGKEESVIIYIAVMQNMFNRLPNKLAEQEKLKIILKNLQPYYQRALCRDEIYSISDLINVLRIIERTKVNCDNFQEPKNFRSILEPDLAYKSPVEGSDVFEVKEMASKPTDVIKMRCWNCRETGHLFRGCPLPKQRLFCFRCGRFGITSKDCTCKGNAAGGSSRAAQ